MRRTPALLVAAAAVATVVAVNPPTQAAKGPLR
jgi:hypothetical protein